MKNLKGRRPIVYISGPMRGLPGFNYPAFHDAAARYRAAGAAVFNPAETFGGDTDVDYSTFMAIDLAAVRASDLVVMLDGWQSSQGAKQEWTEAMQACIPWRMASSDPAAVLRELFGYTLDHPSRPDGGDEGWDNRGCERQMEEEGLTPPMAPLVDPKTRAWREGTSRAALKDWGEDVKAGGPILGEVSHNAVRDTYLPTIKDSGKRETFSTGSRRDLGAGKGRWDLLPYGALRRLALIYEGGAAKYGDRNWEKGQPFGRVASSGLHHLMRWLDGRRDEDHLAMAAWNILALLEYEERIKAHRLPDTLADTPGAGQELAHAGRDA